MNSYPSQENLKAHLKPLRKAAWATWERQFGHRIPESIKAEVEEKLPFIDDDVYIRDLKKHIPELLVPILLESGFRANDEHSEPESQGRLYRGPLQKRLYVVDFIIREGKLLTLANIINRSFKPHERIKWGAILQKWNSTHPHETKTVPLLKAKFYAAIADPVLQKEYFDREWRLILKALEEGLKKWASPNMAEGLLKSITALQEPQQDTDENLEKLRQQRRDIIDRISNRKGAK